MATNVQKGRIKKFQKLLNIDDELYAEMLFNRFGVDSSTLLSDEQAEQFVKELKAQAIQSGVYESAAAYKMKYKGKYENKTIADGKATPKQCRYVEYLWSKVSRMDTEEKRKEALNRFLKRIVSCEHIEWLEKRDVQKVILAIENMKK